MVRRQVDGRVIESTDRSLTLASPVHLRRSIVKTKQYVRKIYRNISSDDYSPCPMELGIRLEDEESRLLESDEVGVFRVLLGMAGWLATAGRADIGLVMALFSRWSVSPRKSQMEAVRNGFVYLMSHPSFELTIDLSRVEGEGDQMASSNESTQVLNGSSYEFGLEYL